MRNDHSVGRRWSSIAAAALYGVAAGLAIADKDPAAFLVAVALAAALVLLAVACSSQGASLVLLVALATGLHMAIALAVHAFAPGFGIGAGFVTGDDANYFHVSEQMARYFESLPVDQTGLAAQTLGSEYHFGTFVYLETGLFRLFGPDVRIPLLVNAAVAVTMSIFIYASAVHLFDRRAALLAAAIVAFDPSMILWSSLNLRDPLVMAVAVLAVWSLISFAAKPRPLILIVPFVAAAELVNLRAYVAAAIAIAAVLSIAVAPMLRPGRRLMIAALVATIAVLVVLQSTTTVTVSGMSVRTIDQILNVLEDTRAGDRLGNTALVDPTKPSDAPVLVRTLAYLPIGVAYAIVAPVPLLATRTQERIAAPEMLIWYFLCVSAVVTCWRERRHWRTLAPPILTIVGLLLLVALRDGNVGGVFRHRSTVVPFMALLAAPTALRVYDRRFRHRSGPRAVREEPPVTSG